MEKFKYVLLLAINMKTLKILPNNGLKPISRESLARCIEVQTQDKDLAELVRNDSSFDVAIISSSMVNYMTVELFKYNGKVPVFNSYCGHAIEKIMNKLPYGMDYTFSSSVKIN
jgi:hypothetical protein